MFIYMIIAQLEAGNKAFTLVTIIKVEIRTLVQGLVTIRAWS